MKAVMFLQSSKSELLPLTNKMPGCMMRLCGRSLLEYNLELLADCGVKECTLVVKNGLSFVKNQITKEKSAGISLRFCREFHGFHCQCEESNVTEYPRQPIIIMNDQILCDFALKQMVKSYLKDGDDLTCAGIDRATRFGKIPLRCNQKTNGAGNIDTEFWNTGIYIISPQAADIIINKKIDTSESILHSILQSGMKISVWHADGYWNCVDSLRAYLQAQRDLLNQNVRCRIHGTRDEHGNVFAGKIPRGNYQMNAPVFIGNGVQLGNGAIIKAGSVLDDRCFVGPGAVIDAAALLPYSFVGERSFVQDGIVCAKAAVKTRCVVQNDMILQNAKKRIPTFCKNTCKGEVGVELTAQFAAELGCAVGTAAGGQTIGITTDECSCSRVLSSALIAGIRSTGTSVFHFGHVFPSLFRFALNYNALSIGISIRAGTIGSIEFVEKNAEESTLEQRILALLAKKSFARVSWDNFGGYVNMSGMQAIYCTEILHMAPNGLSDTKAMVNSSSEAVKNTLTEALQKLGCILSNEVCIHLSKDGMDLCLSDTNTNLDCKLTKALGNHIDREMVYEKGEDSNAFFNKSLVETAAMTRGISERNMHSFDALEDGLMLAVKILNYMQTHQLTLRQLGQLLPQCSGAKHGGKNEFQATEKQEKKNGVLLICPIKQEICNDIFEQNPQRQTVSDRCAKKKFDSNALLDNECRNG